MQAQFLSGRLPGSGRTARVSAVIPTCDRADELMRCLRSLEGLCDEVWVVDNGSRDSTPEQVRREFPWVRLIENAQNLGAALAKNQGALASSGEVLWFLDSDTQVPGAGVVARALDLLLSDPATGAVGGELHEAFHRNNKKYNVRYWRIKHLMFNGETRTESLAPDSGGPRQVDYLPSCNLFIRRSLFLAQGGFDPGYFFLSEDADLCLRLRRAGYACVADPGAAVLHAITLRDRPGDLALAQRNRVRMALLHFSSVRAAMLPLMDLLYLVHPYKVRSAWQGRVSVEKHLPPELRLREGGRASLAARLRGAGILYLRALAQAYAWNLRHLPATLRQRRDRPDFLVHAPGVRPGQTPGTPG